MCNVAFDYQRVKAPHITVITLDKFEIQCIKDVNVIHRYRIHNSVKRVNDVTLRITRTQLTGCPVVQ